MNTDVDTGWILPHMKMLAVRKFPCWILLYLNSEYTDKQRSERREPSAGMNSIFVRKHCVAKLTSVFVLSLLLNHFTK